MTDPLLLRARAGDLASLREAMTRPLSADRATALMREAALHGHASAVRLLLLHVQNRATRSALLVEAAARGHHRVVRVLAPLADRHAEARSAAEAAHHDAVVEVLTWGDGAG